MHWIDPDHLPETTGLVDCFLLNADGEADGVVLTDGTEIHFPPHMGNGVLAAVRLGSTIHVRGVRPRGAAMIAAVSIAPEEGARIVDAGPPEDEEGRKGVRKQAHVKRTAMAAQGWYGSCCTARRVKFTGCCWKTAGWPLPAARGRSSCDAAGTERNLLLRGDGLVTPHGTVIAIREVGTSADDLRRIEARKPKDKHPKHKHGDHKPHRPGSHDGNPDAAHPL